MTEEFTPIDPLTPSERLCACLEAFRECAIQLEHLDSVAGEYDGVGDIIESMREGLARTLMQVVMSSGGTKHG
jgi:hypothetical protein